MAPRSSTLAWKTPWLEEPGRLQSMGSLRVHSSVLAWRIPGAGDLVGCRLWGRRVRHDWSDWAAFCIPHLLSPFICWWTFRLFPALFVVNYNAAVNMGVNIYLQDSDIISFGFINPEVGLLDDSVQSLSCDPMNWSTPGSPVHHQFLKLAQTHVHWVGDAIQPSHPLSSPSLPAFDLSQHQGLSQWVSSSHQVAKILEFQLQHHSLQWIFRADSL